MLNRISAKTYRTWAEYISFYGFTDERADLRSGIVASVIANVNRSKRGKSYKPSDFIPKFGPKKKQSVDEMRTLLTNFARVHNPMISGAKKNG